MYVCTTCGTAKIPCPLKVGKTREETISCEEMLLPQMLQYLFEVYIRQDFYKCDDLGLGMRQLCLHLYIADSIQITNLMMILSVLQTI